MRAECASVRNSKWEDVDICYLERSPDLKSKLRAFILGEKLGGLVEVVLERVEEAVVGAR